MANDSERRIGRGLRPELGYDAMVTFRRSMREAVRGILDPQMNDRTFTTLLDTMDAGNERYMRETGRAAIDVYDGEGVRRRNVLAELRLIRGF